MSTTTKKVGAPSQGGSTSATPPPALNLASVKKTNLDIFAVAPQVKKMTRRAKARLELENVKQPRRAGDSNADPAPTSPTQSAKKSAQQPPTGPASSPNDAGDLFRSVFVKDEAPPSDARAGPLRQGKRPLLRHALHANPEEDARTIFVGNLPNTITKREVERFFKDCGAIASVRVRSQALEAGDEKSAKVGRGIRVLRGELRQDDRCRATAYVLFRDAVSVARGLGKNGLVLRGRHVVVTTLRAEDAAYAPETSVFIGNISYDTSEEEVWNFFVEQGVPDVRRVRLIRDRETGAGKGFGYVEFHSPASVPRAIATRGSVLNGREIRIVHANKSKAVSATVASRREKRRGVPSDPQPVRGAKRPRHAVEDRGGKVKRQRKEGSGEKGTGRGPKAELPSWVGVVTNPRKKIPKDLRSLIGGEKPKPKGPRPPVKHKMRNPEKA